MEVGKFIELFLSYGNKFSNESYLGLNWQQWRNLSSAAGGIDFSCAGESSERCSGLYQGSCMACCTECSYQFGYLNILPNNMMIIREIADKYNEETGFFVKERCDTTGDFCRLPRPWRSPTCLSFYCKDDISNLQKTYLDLLQGNGHWIGFVKQAMMLENSRIKRFRENQIQNREENISNDKKDQEL